MNVPFFSLRFLSFALLLALASGAVGRTSVLVAQDESKSDEDKAGSNKLPIAIVDVGRLFQGHRLFVEQMGQLKRTVKEAEKKLVVRKTEIEALQKQVREKRPGDADYDNLQLLLARLQAEVKVFMSKQKAELLKRESRLYVQTYQSLTMEIQQYAKQHNIQLVLRVHKRGPNTEKRDSIMSWINRDVIYENGLDITDEILRLVNAKPDA